MNPIWLFITMCRVPPVRIAFELRQVKGFGHHTLAREGRVSVDQNGQHLPAPLIPQLFLPGVRQALEHGIDRLQVARIVRYQHPDLPAFPDVEGLDHVSPVVLYVPRAEKRLRVVMLLEFAEKMFEKLPQNAHLYVETPPVRHAHENFAASCLPRIP